MLFSLFLQHFGVQIQGLVHGRHVLYHGARFLLLAF